MHQTTRQIEELPRSRGSGKTAIRMNDLPTITFSAQELTDQVILDQNLPGVITRLMDAALISPMRVMHGIHEEISGILALSLGGEKLETVEGIALRPNQLHIGCTHSRWNHDIIDNGLCDPHPNHLLRMLCDQHQIQMPAQYGSLMLRILQTTDKFYRLEHPKQLRAPHLHLLHLLSIRLMETSKADEPRNSLRELDRMLGRDHPIKLVRDETENTSLIEACKEVHGDKTIHLEGQAIHVIHNQGGALCEWNQLKRQEGWMSHQTPLCFIHPQLLGHHVDNPRERARKKLAEINEVNISPAP